MLGSKTSFILWKLVIFSILFPDIWGATIRRMPTGLKVLLDFAGRLWTAALRPDQILKQALCLTCPVVGRRTNKIVFWKRIIWIYNCYEGSKIVVVNNNNNNNKDAPTLLGLLDTNGSPNVGQTTGPNNNQQQQKKRTFRRVDFVVPADHGLELKEIGK